MRAIIEYQRQRGLKPDGVIGKVTLASIKEDCGINTDTELAHFMGQCHHETGGFSASVENLNYNADGLLKIFGKYFNAQQAKSFERQPERIANRVYASRMGNGNEASGDGWRFRGRGAIQLTGRANYQSFADYVKDQSIMTNPDLVATKYFLKSAEFFFTRNRLWAIAIRGINDAIITQLTRRINGGINGLADRVLQTNNYHRILNK